MEANFLLGRAPEGICLAVDRIGPIRGEPSRPPEFSPWPVPELPAPVDRPSSLAPRVFSLSSARALAAWARSKSISSAGSAVSARMVGSIGSDFGKSPVDGQVMDLLVLFIVELPDSKRGEERSMSRKNAEIPLAPLDVNFLHLGADHQTVGSNNFQQESLIHGRSLRPSLPGAWPWRRHLQWSLPCRRPVPEGGPTFLPPAP